MITARSPKSGHQRQDIRQNKCLVKDKSSNDLFLVFDLSKSSEEYFRCKSAPWS